MSTPPTSTLLVLNLPPSILCGIDLLTFTTSPNFHGIKCLPPGIHFLFTSPSASLSLRDGFFFSIPDLAPTSPPATLTYKWDTIHENLISCPASETHSLVGEKGGWKEFNEKNLTPYRQSAGTDKDSASREDKWNALTEEITPELLTRFASSDEWRISSASSGMQDRDEIPGLSTQEVGSVIGEEKELGMLGIDLKKTWRDGAVGRERTEGARDRSWVLGDVVERFVSEGAGVDGAKGEKEGVWEVVVLGQMEICFLMVLTLANYSCMEEWKRILAVVLTCERAVWEKPRFFAKFFVILRRQLERADDVEGGLFDMSDDGGAFLKGLLTTFKRTLEQRHGDAGNAVEDVKEEFEEVENWVKEQYQWHLGDEFVRKGMLELEDGEMVEMETGEMEGEDESGEYAPVVVNL